MLTYCIGLLGDGGKEEKREGGGQCLSLYYLYVVLHRLLFLLLYGWYMFLTVFMFLLDSCTGPAGENFREEAECWQGCQSSC